ncbi:hypothetical protein ACFP1Z_27075 [Streptomyces gamaensis]|uniref:Uncharacterized protein n=1 Tax=Streptomyces gamaensis TaxID=1763542 RepID=A0ABW0Z9R2_9ACTN
MAHEDGHYFLRPLGGGREWEARPEDLAPLTPQEALRAKLTAVNARSTGANR